MQDNSSYVPLLLPAFIALLSWYWSRNRSKSAPLPYPPGPMGYPLFGNLLDFPLGVPLWEGLGDLAGQHETDVLHLELPGIHMVVLSSSDAIFDLLDQRSAIYSDKPSTPMIELMKAAEHSMAFMRYGPRWRTHRKLFNDFINLSTVDRYDVNQVKAVSNFLVNLLRNPEALREHINLLTGSLALSIAYGIQADAPDNEFFCMYKLLLGAMNQVFVPGSFAVDILPFLKHLPSWFPGVKFHAYADKANQDMRAAMKRPVEHVAEQLKLGGGIHTSMVSVCLEDLETLNKKGIDIDVISNTAGNVYVGMSDTIDAALGNFFLAMARNTDVMRTAQRHIDNTLGGERLPDHSDLDNLPYIMAIVKETFRWAPTAPIGAVHRLMEDDVYRGMFIPAGSMMVENVWAICYDESLYPEPYTYNPARFLNKQGNIDPSVKAPEARIFGSGRRVCPGRHFAVRMLCLTIARTLTVFDILPPVDDGGRPIVPEARFHNTVIRHAMPFDCVVKPRSEHAVELIGEAIAIHQ